MEEKEIKEKFLPIGSVVILKNGQKKLMILSYLIFPSGSDEKKEMYDYGACTFPEGVVDSKVGIGFNHEDIKEVVHLGLEDDEYKDLNKLLAAHADEVKKQYKDIIAKSNI